MRTCRWLWTGLGALGLALWGGTPAAAQTDAGLASVYPWSGYWWQHKSGGLTGPLGKYDQVSGTAAAAWEQNAHVVTAAEDWFGHCHAWSASSVMEREPRDVRQVGAVGFGVGDQKGLLAACHAADIANTYGDRFGDGAGGDDPNDITPDQLWRVLNLYLQRQKTPLVMDLEAGPQIWNYPIYQYQVQYAPAGGDWYDGVLDLVAADDNVVPDYIGTQYVVHRYTFRVQFRDGALVLGSGQWTGNSVADHPDFAWYPYVAVAENPSVDVARVSSIVGYAVATGRTVPTGEGDVRINPDTPPQPTPDTNPTPPDTNPTPPPDTQPTPTPVDLDSTLDPYELVETVLDQTSAFALDAFVDRGDGGKYHPGEPVKVSLRSGEAGYLYLFDVDRRGEIQLLYPVPGEPNYIQADTLYTFPLPKETPLLLAEGQGQHDIKAIVVNRPVRITGTRQNSTAQQQQQGQAAKPPAGKPQAQPIVVPPTTAKQMKQILLAGFDKGTTGKTRAPGKLGRFAQDQCAYFVLAASGKPGKPAQSRPPTN